MVLGAVQGNSVQREGAVMGYRGLAQNLIYKLHCMEWLSADRDFAQCMLAEAIFWDCDLLEFGHSQ